MTEHFIERALEGVLEFRLNRPEKLNALSPAMLRALAVAVQRFAQDPALRVMLISANGAYFSSGVEVTAEITPPDNGSTLDNRRWFLETYHRLFDELEYIEKPIVVAHQGGCFGGALELSLSCDFRLAARSAMYRLPEIDFGTLPGSGGVSRLTRIAGPHWARWLVMSGESVTAEEAVTMGFVHRVFDDAVFEREVQAFCRKLAGQPREMLAAAKLAIELATDLDRSQGRQVERLANSMLLSGAEHKAKLQAFLDRQAAKRRQRESDGGASS
jgi:enoyl-CoA hydratase